MNTIFTNSSRQLFWLLRIGCCVLCCFLLLERASGLPFEVVFANNLGSNPYGGLVQGSDGYLYGTTQFGGATGNGTVFKISPAGSLTTLHTFNARDGSQPHGDLVEGNDGNFYGTTFEGGTTNNGTIFKIDSLGNFVSIHNFNGGNGRKPEAGLVQGHDGLFYGTTLFGGAGDYGTVYRIGPSGNFSTLHLFNGAHGIYPYSALVQAGDGDLYGTTAYGGTNSSGTVFKISTSGTLTTVHSFNYSQGGSPQAGVIIGSDGAIYGTTASGGFQGHGTVFKISGSGIFTLLHSFSKSDGSLPFARLVQAADGLIYGTTSTGGVNNQGTIFKISVSGGFQSLHHFKDIDGRLPHSKLIQTADGTFFGSTPRGGINDHGVIYKVDISGELSRFFSFVNVTGKTPSGSLVKGGNGEFYGTTVAGGNNDEGAVFKCTAAGILTTLHSFDKINGSNPHAGLAQSVAGEFYGTTYKGGLNDGGTVFKINDSGDFVSLHSFSGSDGRYPRGSLLRHVDGNFYGTTSEGGAKGYGTVFKISATGVLTSLYSFNGNDGSQPYGGVIQDINGNIFGTTYEGGVNNFGTVFMISLDNVFTSLHSFNQTDGRNPQGGLVLSSNGYLYGTTRSGGGNNFGTVFRIHPAGGLTRLHSFGQGGYPMASLVEGNNGEFFGTTQFAGPGGYGTIFRISANGNLTTLHSFDGSVAAAPISTPVIGNDGFLYGTANAMTVWRFETDVSPKILIKGNGRNILSGDSTPTAEDHTSYEMLSTDGGSLTRTFTIVNQGDAVLNLTGTPRVLLTGSASFQVTQQPLSNTISANGGALTFKVTFTPASEGFFTAVVTIASNDEDDSTYTFTVSGNGLDTPRIALRGNGQSIANGDVTPSVEDSTSFENLTTDNGSQTRTFTISNQGTGSLNLASMPIVSLTGSSAFSITQQPGSNIIAPDGSPQNFHVTFAPEIAELHTAIVSIASNDTDRSPFTFMISGTGIDTPKIVLSGNGQSINPGADAPTIDNHTDFGWIPSKSSLIRTFTITNIGTGSLNLTDDLSGRVTVSGSQAFAIYQQPPSSSVIANGGTQSFSIIFAPADTAAHTAYVSFSSNDQENPVFTFAVAGRGFNGDEGYSFTKGAYTAASDSVSIIVNRGLGPAGTVRLRTADGTASAVPPFVAAVEGVDFETVSEVLTFTENETSKTVVIPILPRSGKLPNRRFFVTLSEPVGGMALGSRVMSDVRLLNPDYKAPALRLHSPKGKEVSGVLPLIVSGTAGDANGIDRVEVEYKDKIYFATLEESSKPANVPWNVVLSPTSGPVNLIIRAYDLNGNMTELRHSFDFTRRYAVVITRVLPNGVLPEAAGKLKLKIARGSGSALIPAKGQAVQVFEANSGAEIMVTAIPKSGYIFSHWNLPDQPDVTFERTGLVLNLIMPETDVNGLEAVFIANPWTVIGSKASFSGLLTAARNTPSGNGSYGSVKLTLVSRTGSFTGFLWLDGQKVHFTGQITGNGEVWFKGVDRQLAPDLNLPGASDLQMRGRLDEGEIQLTIVSEQTYMAGNARLPSYSARAPAPASLLNNGKQGFYTFVLPSLEQTPERAPSTYPQGAGFGSVKLGSNGSLKFIGTLPDGSSITAAAAILPGDKFVLHIPLRTPGGKAKELGGSLIGSLRFDPDNTDTDLWEEWLFWFRPSVAKQNGGGKAALETQLYSAGWPEGINIGCLGAKYDAHSKVDAGDPVLEFSDGGLGDPVSYSNFTLNAGKVSKPASDRSYTLKFMQKTGRITGSFTPTWDNAGTKRPAFQGVWISKGGDQGGWGFFMSNRSGNDNRESGLLRLFDLVPP